MKQNGLEIDTHTYGQLIFEKRCIDNSMDKDSLFNNDARITGNIYAK